MAKATADRHPAKGERALKVEVSPHPAMASPISTHVAGAGAGPVRKGVVEDCPGLSPQASMVRGTTRLNSTRPQAAPQSPPATDPSQTFATGFSGSTSRTVSGVPRSSNVTRGGIRSPISAKRYPPGKTSPPPLRQPGHTGPRPRNLAKHWLGRRPLPQSPTTRAHAQIRRTSTAASTPTARPHPATPSLSAARFPSANIPAGGPSGASHSTRRTHPFPLAPDILARSARRASVRPSRTEARQGVFARQRSI